MILNSEGFTGLEAAIVLIAFVVTASVFSYVILGAGFFATQKAQDVVYTSVGQSSSGIEILGDVYGNSTMVGGINAKMDGIRFVVGLTAGGSPVDFASTTLTFQTKDNVTKINNVTKISSSSTDVISDKTAINPGQWGIIDIANYENNDKGALLENQEQFTIYTVFDEPNQISANQEFNLEIRPASGASYGIKRKAPARITKINILN
ncbi:flagellin [Methanoplanus sp. FWC-SCC4]|uniref:Flagellin n=1 Tax=Methanochimaera problematica TaxID=2609417 RepID=A0AA97FAX4_9EURY|nr:archaellin/type IV pilin N-terminal domain-containing protein [Methanoplanus sp. FWC-SCC4]WOF15624.1 flagellin [Methanoplanus sp. FWC-SCC4]